MEHLFEWFHGAIGQDAGGLQKKAGHLFLPTFVDVAAGHAGTSHFKVFRFKVSDQQSVWTQEQGVVVPSCLAQSRQHLRPHAAVSGFIFIQPFRSYLQNEANPLHVVTSRLAKASSQQAVLRHRPHRKKASRSPPSTGITCPVVLALESPASQTIALAQSYGRIGSLVSVRCA